MRKLLVLLPVLLPLMLACTDKPEPNKNKASMFFNLARPKGACWTIEDNTFPHSSICKLETAIFYCIAWSTSAPECKQISEVVLEVPKEPKK